MISPPQLGSSLLLSQKKWHIINLKDNFMCTQSLPNSTHEIYLKVQDATATQQLALFPVVFRESVVHPLHCRFALDSSHRHKSQLLSSVTHWTGVTVSVTSSTQRAIPMHYLKH